MAGEAGFWESVWPTVAATLAEDKFVPKFLTEDGIRTVALHALDAHMDVVRWAETEYPAVYLGGEQLGRLDLVAKSSRLPEIVEFKYPREPRQTLPPWPDHLGGVLSDAYRLGILAASGRVGRCILVLVSAVSFLRYVKRTMTRLELAHYEPGALLPDEIRLLPGRTAKLASTTRRQLKGRDQVWQVTATSTAVIEIAGKGLWLGAYEVIAVGTA
jgi:hypothetical protein